jgi:hypothetical protein
MTLANQQLFERRWLPQTPQLVFGPFVCSRSSEPATIESLNRGRANEGRGGFATRSS